jgi:membrane-bound metal-dependent hydrolase YbcI (DUF457 family)
VAPRASLGTLFLAAQFLDLLWPTLLLLGIETVHIAPGATAVTPLLFEHYPFSHSLLAAAGWAMLAAAAFWMLRRDRAGAATIGLLVLSHWLLDAVVHQPDLPLVPGSPTMAGLGLWASLPATLAVEMPLFLLGAWLYARSTAAIDRRGNRGWWALALLLLLIHAGNLLGDPPPSATAIAWVGQGQWLLVLFAYWVDRHRTPVALKTSNGAARHALF